MSEADPRGAHQDRQPASDLPPSKSEVSFAFDGLSTLVAIADAISSGNLPSPAAVDWFRLGVVAYLAGAPLEAALGLGGGPGQRSAVTRLRLKLRDEALRHAAQHFFGGLSRREQAERLAQALRRRAAVRSHSEPDPGSLAAALAQIGEPLSARTIRGVIGGKVNRSSDGHLLSPLGSELPLFPAHDGWH